jgi:glycosyltransferase involved in cell wall biosynthesis
MRVLMITGDKKFGPGHERYELQQSVVDDLAVVYWGRGALWPTVPAGHFDVVTVQDPFWRGLFAWRVARRLGAKFNVQVHTDLGVYSWLKRTLATYVLCKANSIRVVSNNIKQQVEQIGVRAKILVLPVFVDVSRFKNLVHKAHDKKTILWAGRFEDEKDPLCAVSVYKEVLKSIPDTKLILLGKGSLEPRLRAEAGEFKHIEFPGWQDPAVYLPIADVVLSTSKHESWGASIVEALAAGVPIVAPDVGIAREAGAIVAPRTELAKAVVEALHSNARGVLTLPLFSKDEWARAWVQTLQNS